MKKNIFYLFAHQDDEFGVFIDIEKKILDYNVYIIYLTSGYDKKISESKLSKRDNESIKVLSKIGVKKKNIYFFGKQLQINTNQLILNINKAYFKLKSFMNNKRPFQIVTLAWEGGHEDHDACNILGRKLGYNFKIINNCEEFSLYNAFNCNFIYFRVFNALKKSKIIKTNFFNRFKYVTFLFSYKSQLKIWFGLYPFIIYHYIFKGYNCMQSLNKSKTISRPHKGKLLYESRKYFSFNKFKFYSKFFL